MNGEPVIWRTYQATSKTALFDAVYVVTDSDIIFDEIRKRGGRVLKSVEQHESGSDRIAEAVSEMDVDIVVNVQGDEPFTERDSLEQLLDVFKADEAGIVDLASLMVRIDDPLTVNDPNTVKVIVDQDQFAMYFSRSVIPYKRNQESDQAYYKHKGVYAFRKSALMDFARLPMSPLESAEKIECLRYLENGKKIKMVETTVEGVEIDTPEDLERAKALWK